MKTQKPLPKKDTRRECLSQTTWTPLAATACQASSWSARKSTSLSKDTIRNRTRCTQRTFQEETEWSSSTSHIQSKTTCCTQRIRPTRSPKRGSTLRLATRNLLHSSTRLRIVRTTPMKSRAKTRLWSCCQRWAMKVGMGRLKSIRI